MQLPHINAITQKQTTKTNFKAPAVALGPNHIPTSCPAAFPVSTMRCRPNGAGGVSRNHEMRRAHRACTGCVGGRKVAVGVGR
jgi:hypothetical protein